MPSSSVCSAAFSSDCAAEKIRKLLPLLFSGISFLLESFESQLAIGMNLILPGLLFGPREIEPLWQQSKITVSLIFLSIKSLNILDSSLSLISLTPSFHVLQGTIDWSFLSASNDKLFITSLPWPA